MGLAIGRQGHEDNVLAASRLNLPRAQDAPGIRQQHNLQQNGRIKGRSAGHVIAEAGFKDRKVKAGINNPVDSPLKTAGQNLSTEVDSQHGLLVVGIIFKAWHRDTCKLRVTAAEFSVVGFFYSLNALVQGRILERRRSRSGKICPRSAATAPASNCYASTLCGLISLT